MFCSALCPGIVVRFLSPLLSVFPVQPPDDDTKFSLQCSEVGAPDTLLGVDHQVQGPVQREAVLTKDFAQQPLGTVAYHSIADLLRDGQAEPGTVPLGDGVVDHHGAGEERVLLRVDLFETAAPGDPVFRPERLDASSAQGVLFRGLETRVAAPWRAKAKRGPGPGVA